MFPATTTTTQVLTLPKSIMMMTGRMPRTRYRFIAACDARRQKDLRQWLLRDAIYDMVILFGDYTYVGCYSNLVNSAKTVGRF